MKYMLTVLMLLVATSASLADEKERRNVISAAASATVNAPADYATIDVIISSLSQKAVESTQDVATIHTKVEAALTRLSIKAEDVTTTNFRVGPEYSRNDRGQQGEFKGYRTDHHVLVKVRKMDQTGAAIDACIEAGASRVGDVRFVTEPSDERYETLLAEAVKRARARAETMATAAGGKLGDLIALNLGGAPNPRRQPAVMSAYSDNSTQLNPGQNQFSVTVSGRWAFIGGGK
jgi:uncharacterized protein YggE